MDWRLAVAILLAALLTLLVLSRQWQAWRRSVRARRRGARAVRGEREAEVLLREAGYEILERQLGVMWEIECDGEPVEFLLRADLLVARDGHDFIAEVKTGNLAPSLANASTRRQMLEYSIAFDSPTVLLVDVERGEILEVSFPWPEEAANSTNDEASDEDAPNEEARCEDEPELGAIADRVLDDSAAGALSRAQ